jgi:hypothetical protein
MRDAAADARERAAAADQRLKSQIDDDIKIALARLKDGKKPIRVFLDDL